ncbi:MAG: DUF1592 domain-containing protein [Myxococcota bacterium]
MKLGHAMAWVAALGLAACTGLVDDGPARPGSNSGLGEAAPTTRFARLTHPQWEQTVRDLLHLPGSTGLMDELRQDPGSGGYLFDNDALKLSVDGALWQGYQGAAVELAARVVDDPSLLVEITPPDEGADPRERAEQFVREFGLRAHRRPLTGDEVAEYMALYDAAPPLDPDRPDFEAGVRLMLEAFLQSPFFLYRVEESEEPEGFAIPLDDYEVASRLSYLLWNTMPDDALFEAAAAGQLTDPDGVAAEAARMLDDPRAEEVLVRFHEQLLEVDQYGSVAPADAFFPDAPDDLGALAEREADLFLHHVLNTEQGGWSELLTSTETFVNEATAPIYDVEGTFDADFTRVGLDPDQRRGVFTQIGFLAAHASSAQPDPIHRGVFLAERIACIHISAPPDDIPPLPSVEGNTNREVVENHTEDPGTVCASCHEGIINPFGFPFEGFDAIGGTRTEDNGFPVDTAEEPMLAGQRVPVADALELADLMATDADVHDCYAQHWVEYAFGRPSVEQDEALVQRLGAESLDGASVRRLLADLVTSDAFLTRSTEELP